VALLFTLLACVLSVLLFGLAPALQTTRPELAHALKAGGAVSRGSRRFFGRNALVSAFNTGPDEGFTYRGWRR